MTVPIRIHRESVPFQESVFRLLMKGFIITGAWLLQCGPAFALQVHPAPEGLYAHQLAHVFFIVTMGVFTFWLKKRKLTKERGWRYIRLSCLLFILWNIDGILGHAMDSRLADSAFVGKGWSRALLMDALGFPYVYYLLKLDHLLCVPAIACFYIGLKRLWKDTRGETP